MLYDGVDEATAHAADLIQRIDKIATATGKAIYAYEQDQFLAKAKELQFPAVGIFYNGLNANTDKGRRSESGEMVFDLIIVDDTSGSGCFSASGTTTTATTLLSLIRQELFEPTIALEKSWDFKSELPFDLGEKNKIAYVQRWTAILTKT